MKPFEAFAPGREGTHGAPVVYVLSAGRLILNAAAARALGDTAWVQLLWDEDSKQIGIQPTTQDDPLAFRVTQGASQATITSKAFVDAHKLPHKTRMRLAWTGVMWVASTTDPANPTP